MLLFFENPIGLVLMVASIIIALGAQAHVTSAYAKYAKVRAKSKITGAQLAEMIVGASGVKVALSQGGRLSDHFDPRNNTIALSQEVYNGDSVAALGIAAHEAGHALQYNEGYTPIQIRNGILPFARIGSGMAVPLVVAGLLFGATGLGFLVDVGIIFFMVALLFQLITLPVEFNASRRAVDILEGNMYLTEEESLGARAVLRAAAMTYVAAVVTSLLQLLRLLMIAGRRS
jgi:Zn-dependent membrane protease YugP